MAADHVAPNRLRDQRFAERVARWERLTDAATPLLMRALDLAPGERVLDVGCGAGGAALRAAAAVGPRGAVVAVDRSPSVTAHARARAAATGCANVSFQVADAQVADIDGAPFSAAMSQFGVLFFTDPVAAFANLRRHLGRNGRLCFTCWRDADSNPWSFAAALADLIPGASPAAQGRPAPGPFSLADGAHLRATLHSAGFGQVDVRPHSDIVDVPEDTIVDDVELGLMGVPSERLSDARERVSRQLAPHRGPRGELHLPLSYCVVTARS